MFQIVQVTVPLHRAGYRVSYMISANDRINRNMLAIFVMEIWWDKCISVPSGLKFGLVLFIWHCASAKMHYKSEQIQIWIYWTTLIWMIKQFCIKHPLLIWNHYIILKKTDQQLPHKAFYPSNNERQKSSFLIFLVRKQ